MKVTSSPNTLIAVFVIALVVWLVSFYQGITTAYDVWIISEIFNHCLFVLPCSLYFIYRKRVELIRTGFQPTLLPLVIVAGCLFVQLFGEVGGINIFMHIATFVALPCLIWSLIGHQAAKVIAFPLSFILFCIPVGDQLVPYLQELTTDIAVPMLKLTGVPIFRNGLYLEIPEGRFLVAEACSGISFLISSIVFGFFYSYISFSSFKRRIAFIAASCIVPILANAIRVYGIVLIGHISDMEHAVGTDHLVYGGVFFGIVLFLLIIIGEQFRDIIKADDGNTSSCEQDNQQVQGDYNVLPFSVLVVLATLQQMWFWQVSNVDITKFNNPVIAEASNVNFVEQSIISWQPEFDAPDAMISGVFKHLELNIDAYIYYYNGDKGELISSAHRLYNDQNWSLVANQTLYINGDPVTLSEVASLSYGRRIIMHWFEVEGRHFNSQTKAKLYQAYLLLSGQQARGAKILLSVPKQRDSQNAFSDYVAQSYQAIRYQLYQSVRVNNQ